MEKERARPFLLEPVYHGAPLSWVQKYFRGRLHSFRKENAEFDEFLNGIEKEINERQLDYCGNILLFLNGEAEPNWISPKNSLFKMFIKLYNYDFSSKQAVDYIEKCHETYLFLIDNKLKLSNEYSVYSKRNRWDGSTIDYLEISLSPIKETKDWDDYYFIDLVFGSYQEHNRDLDYSCNLEIHIKSGREIYEDSLKLFDYYQGNKYLNQVLQFAISELLKKKIITGPHKIDYGHTVIDYYPIKRPHTYSMEGIEKWR